MKPIRKTRPQRHINGCTDCDGLGRWSEDDGDREDPQVVVLTCETCDGTGLVSDCNHCDEPTAISELELLNGVCGQCAAAREMAS